MLKILEGLSDYQSRVESSFAAWAFTIARNHVISSVRREKYRKRNEQSFSESFDPSDNHSKSIETQALDNVVYRNIIDAARLLSPALKEVILLRFEADLSINDTAKVLSKKHSAVKVLQHKGVARLRKMFAQQENQVA